MAKWALATTCTWWTIAFYAHAWSNIAEGKTIAAGPEGAVAAGDAHGGRRSAVTSHKGVEGIVLLQNPPENPPTIIHALPKMMPDNGQYADRLKQIYRQAVGYDVRDVEHQEKLERQNEKLRRKVAALSEALGDAEAERVEEEHELKKERAAAASKKTEATPAAASAGATSYSLGELGANFVLIGILLAAEAFTLTQTKSVTIRSRSWIAIEMVVAAFVAVLWVQAMDDFFEFVHTSTNMLALSVFLHAVTVFAVFIAILWKLRTREMDIEPAAESMSMMKAELQKREGQFLILAALGAHYVSFFGAHVGGVLQETYFASRWYWCVLSIVVLILLLVGVAFLLKFIVRRLPRTQSDSKFIEKIEELEDDVGGMVLAFAWTMLVRFMIVGIYPSWEDGETGEMQHSWRGRLAFFVYAVLMAVLALFGVRKVHAMAADERSRTNYMRKRALTLLEPFLTMSTAWAFLLWGDWAFYEAAYRGQPVMGRLQFAFVASLVSGILIAVGAHRDKMLPNPDRNSRDPALRKKSLDEDMAKHWIDMDLWNAFLRVIAVIVAYAWEEVLDASLEGVAQDARRQVFLKFFVALFLTAVLVPIYAIYLYPLTEKTEEEEEAELGLSYSRPHPHG